MTLDFEIVLKSFISKIMLSDDKASRGLFCALYSLLTTLNFLTPLEL